MYLFTDGESHKSRATPSSPEASGTSDEESSASDSPPLQRKKKESGDRTPVHKKRKEKSTKTIIELTFWDKESAEVQVLIDLHQYFTVFYLYQAGRGNCGLLTKTLSCCLRNLSSWGNKAEILLQFGHNVHHLLRRSNTWRKKWPSSPWVRRINFWLNETCMSEVSVLSVCWTFCCMIHALNFANVWALNLNYWFAFLPFRNWILVGAVAWLMMCTKSCWMDSRKQSPLRSKVHEFMHEAKMCPDRCTEENHPCIPLLLAVQEPSA